MVLDLEFILVKLNTHMVRGFAYTNGAVPTETKGGSVATGERSTEKEKSNS